MWSAKTSSRPVIPAAGQYSGTGLLPKLNQGSDYRNDGNPEPGQWRNPRLWPTWTILLPRVFAITRQVIEAIRRCRPRAEPHHQSAGIRISTARTVEKALYARRLLLSGRQVPEVYATEVAREHADKSIAELDKEIENLLFETGCDARVVSTRLPPCCNAPRPVGSRPENVQKYPTIDPRPLSNGRVQ